jgi:hypothetical protein
MGTQSKDAAENESRWREHVERIESHRGTLTSYCRAHGLSLEGLKYWRNKVEAEACSVEKRTLPSAFIPVQVLSSGEVTPSDDRRLPDPKWLAEVLMHLSSMNVGGSDR